MKHFLMTAMAVSLMATPAFANQAKEIDGRAQLSEEQNTKLTVAMKDAGCEGGKVTTEGKNVVVKNTTCGESTYDLMFDSNFGVSSKTEVN